MAMSSSLLNPADVVKIRMQTDGQLNPNSVRIYSGFRQTFYKNIHRGRHSRFIYTRLNSHQSSRIQLRRFNFCSISHI
eukprot:UN04024